jgi:acyl carrier protein
MNKRSVDYNEIAELVISTLQNVLLEKETASKETASIDAVGELTTLVGYESILDSLGLVALLVDLEQRLEEEYSLSLTLADERAMSQRNSPFRTVQSLTNYVCLLIKKARQNDRP